MNTNTLILTIFALLLVTAVRGQDSLYQAVQVSEFAFEPAIINSDMSTTPLLKESALVSIFSKTKKMVNEVIISKPHSTVIVKSNTPKLVVRNGSLFGSLLNPRDRIKLYKLTVNEKKGKRSATISEQEISGTGKIIGNNSAFDLPVTFKKIKEDVYLIEVGNLEPGEYALASGIGYYSFKVE